MEPSSIAKWNQRFAISGVAEVVPGHGGLPKLRISTPAGSAEIYLHGAQVTSWTPAGGEEVLFLSEQSRWEEGRAIRGGVPICFPWFRGKADNPQAPAHGVVRTRPWAIESLTQSGGAVTVCFSIASDEATLRWYPHEFRVVHRVTAGSTLKMELIVENTGTTPMRFEEALHTYHRVQDVTEVVVSGLDGLVYLDNMDGNRAKSQGGDIVLSKQTDSAFLETANAFAPQDKILRRTIRTEKENSQTTVVWNPWAEGAAALADLGNEEWRKMVCLEASNIMAAAIDLAPGEQHTMSATLSVAPDSN
jgi:glucose-6-phosphate 1-epimerase